MARTSSARRRWHVAARVLAAALLGYVAVNTVGVFFAVASPGFKVSNVVASTLASFLLWALIAMWVFSVRRTRTAVFGLLAAVAVSGAGSWLLVAQGVGA